MTVVGAEKREKKRRKSYSSRNKVVDVLLLDGGEGFDTEVKSIASFSFSVVMVEM